MKYFAFILMVLLASAYQSACFDGGLRFTVDDVTYHFSWGNEQP